jgi:hypothetical protein
MAKKKTKLPTLPRAKMPKVKPVAKLAKRAGIDPSALNTYLDKISKAKARHDHRVALNAQDTHLRNFGNAHLRAQTIANPNLAQAYFPGIADLPMPRPPR